MFYPFVTHSLTRKIEKKIHRAVRLEAPVKYFSFRFTAYFERAGFVLGVMSLFVYFIGHAVARSTGHADSAQLAELVDVLAKVLVVSISISAVSAILQSILFKELEPLAERAIRRIVNS